MTARPRRMTAAEAVPAPTGALRFAAAARVLADQARALGITAPQFRSPPRRPDVDRTIRRGVQPVVAVRTQGRPFVAVAADMVEGVIAANGLHGGDALRARSALWDRLVEEDHGLAA